MRIAYTRLQAILHVTRTKMLHHTTHSMSYLYMCTKTKLAQPRLYYSRQNTEYQLKMLTKSNEKEAKNTNTSR